jgi:hypothetical protein
MGSITRQKQVATMAIMLAAKAFGSSVSVTFVCLFLALCSFCGCFRPITANLFNQEACK